MNQRELNKKSAETTLKILEAGFYINNHNQRVEIKKSLDYCVKNSHLFTIKDTNDLLTETEALHMDDTRIEVTNETTLEATERLIKTGFTNMAVLNFASAKNPGGGFLKGSSAQEESLARSSGLYSSLTTNRGFYEYNRQLTSGLYSDYMIYSPRVPVFKNDNGILLDRFYEASIITSPAVNAGTIKKREGVEGTKQIHLVMKKRIEKILSLAIHYEHDTIVLGAFGCGVFENNPEDVAGYFKTALTNHSRWANQFKQITFAVYDTSPGKKTFLAFKKAFEHQPKL